MIRKATRQKAKLRIGLSSPSGAGKTYSAILLATGIASNPEKICLIDTENGRGDLYSHLCAYNIITLQAPFTPESYIKAIKECEAADMEVIIIDSISHEWEGSGGLLEANELLAKSKYKGNTWSAWSETTPRHQKFIEALITSKCHIITTVRNKIDTIMTDDKKVKKVGTKEITREGFEYELMVNFNIDRDTHTAIASKDNTGIFKDETPFVITKETGEKLVNWANEGVEPVAPPAPNPTLIKKQKIMGLANMLKLDPKNVVQAIEDKTAMKLVEQNFDEILGRLKVLLEEQIEANKHNAQA